MVATAAFTLVSPCLCPVPLMTVLRVVTMDALTTWVMASMLLPMLLRLTRVSEWTVTAEVALLLVRLFTLL